MTSTPEQQIRAVFPDAICITQVIPGGIRYVVRPSKKVANPIGIGATEKAAWVVATQRIRVEVRE